MTRLLMIVSSAHKIGLADVSEHAGAAGVGHASTPRR
jgi:hypothetical protein